MVDQCELTDFLVKHSDELLSLLAELVKRVLLLQDFGLCFATSLLLPTAGEQSSDIVLLQDLLHVFVSVLFGDLREHPEVAVAQFTADLDICRLVSIHVALNLGDASLLVLFYHLRLEVQGLDVLDAVLQIVCH